MVEMRSRDERFERSFTPCKENLPYLLCITLSFCLVASGARATVLHERRCASADMEKDKEVLQMNERYNCCRCRPIEVDGGEKI